MPFCFEAMFRRTFFPKAISTFVRPFHQHHLFCFPDAFFLQPFPLAIIFPHSHFNFSVFYTHYSVSFTAAILQHVFLPHCHYHHHHHLQKRKTIEQKVILSFPSKSKIHQNFEIHKVDSHVDSTIIWQQFPIVDPFNKQIWTKYIRSDECFLLTCIICKDCDLNSLHSL